MVETVQQVIESFTEAINQITGVHIDAILGFGIYRSRMEQLAHFSTPNSTIFFGSEDPSYPTSFIQHETTINILLTRNEEDGDNHRWLGNLCLVAIYAYWEDEYRARLATALSLKEKKELKSDVMGEIRKLRNAIIHNGGIATKEVEDLLIFPWFKRGEGIGVTKDNFEQIAKLDFIH
jgi:hypothetical protein